MAFEESIREAAHRAEEAVTGTIEHYNRGGITEEEDITGTLSGKLKAQRDAEHAGRGIWEGSYVEPLLFRACKRSSGRPGDCSDDASAHP